jgi:hypothetical protein
MAVTAFIAAPEGSGSRAWRNGEALNFPNRAAPAQIEPEEVIGRAAVSSDRVDYFALGSNILPEPERYSDSNPAPAARDSRNHRIYYTRATTS